MQLVGLSAHATEGGGAAGEGPYRGELIEDGHDLATAANLCALESRVAVL